jgi:fibronectin type 3 domain-containing protein
MYRRSVEISPGLRVVVVVAVGTLLALTGCGRSVVRPPNPLSTPPTAPANLTASALSATQVGLSWTASTGSVGIAMYEVFRNGSSMVLAQSAETSYNDTSVIANTTYSYVVKAVDTASNISAASNTAQVTTPAIAAPPTIAITAPSSTGAYTATSSTVNVAGTASDSGGVTQVRWTTSTGGSGIASGTSTWSISSVALAPGSNVVSVTAYDAAGLATTAVITINYSPATAPSTAPTGLAATPGSTIVGLSWNTVGGATSYNVYRNGTLAGSATTNSFSDTGLTNGTTYSYAVSAVNSVGSGPESAPVSTTPNVPLPNTPTGLTAAPGSATVSLSWSTVAGASNYNLYRNGVLISSPGVASFSDTGLTNGTTYSYTVAAVNGAGVSPNSAPVSATPSASTQPPVTPTGLVGVPGQATAILSWNPVGGATGYNVYRSLSASTVGALVGTPTGAPFTDMGIDSNYSNDDPHFVPTIYYYVISAVNGAGVSSNSSQVSVTPNYLVPAAPENFVAVPGNASVSLTWTTRELDTTPASSFLVYRNGTLIASPSTDSYTDTGLTNGTAYTYIVAAVSSLGQSPNSTRQTVTPLATTTVPAAPTGVTASPSNATVMLNWNAVTGATSYNVYRNGASVATPSGASFPDSHLVNGIAYSYVVFAVGSGGTGVGSLPVSATPSGSAPVAPLGLTTVAGNTFVTLSWNVVNTATGYNVYRDGSLVGSTLINGFTDIALANGTTYSYQVTATDVIGEGAMSAAASATPLASIIPAAGSYAQPCTVGFLGDQATLTEYTSKNRVLLAGCTAWESYGLRCDQTNLILDHVHIIGGLYWTGAGSLTITNSIIEGELGIAAIEAHAGAPQANAVITITDSTLRWATRQVMPPGNDSAPIWTSTGEQAIVMLRCDSSGMPQGVNPTPNSVIDSNYIHNLFQNYARSGYPSDTHLDGIYSQGGSNIIIQRNYSDAPVRGDTTSTMFVQNRTGLDTGIQIYANFFNGGGYTLANQTGLLVNVMNNTFAGALFGYVGYYGGTYQDTYGTWAGNVYTDGSTVPVP